MSDQYIQQAVRLENLKEGEARKIAKFFDEITDELVDKYFKYHDSYVTSHRMGKMEDAYSELVTRVTNQLRIKNTTGPMEFVSNNLTTHYENLVMEITGTDAAAAKRMAAADGYDVNKPVWRGSYKNQIGRKDIGTYFSPDKAYAASFHQGMDDLFAWDGKSTKKQATEHLDKLIEKGYLHKYYLPKDGFVDLRDKKIQKELALFSAQLQVETDIERHTHTVKRYAEIMKVRGLDMQERAFLKKAESYLSLDKKTKLAIAIQEVKEDILEFAGPKGLPHYENEMIIRKFLDKNYPKWKYTNMYEEDYLSRGDKYRWGNQSGKKAYMSYLTRDRGVAKSQYALFGTMDGPPAGMMKGNLGAAIVNANLSPEAIVVAANAEPFHGKIMEDWITTIDKKTKNLISQRLRASWIEGESVGRAQKQIGKVLNQTRTQLMTLTRTYYAHLAAQTRDAVWKENEDIIEGYWWDSILDNRTTIEICAPRDQKLYDKNHKPVGHNLPWGSGPGMAHWGCRSMSFPKVKGVVKRAERQAISAGKEYERGDNLTRTGRVRVNSKHARDKGIYTDTTVGVKTDYEKWLKRQPKAFQEDVLGVAKAKAFRAGKWKLGSKFVPENPKALDGIGYLPTAKKAVKKAAKKAAPVKKPPVKKKKVAAPKKKVEPKQTQNYKQIDLDDEPDLDPVKIGNNDIQAQIKPKGFKPAKSVKEAEEYARKNGFAKVVDYEGMDLDAVNEINMAMYAHTKDFPKIEKMSYIGNAAKGELRAQKIFQKEFGPDWPIGESPAKALAYARRKSNFIHGPDNVDGIYYVDKHLSEPFFSRLQQNLAHSVETKFHPYGGGNLYSSTVHELGHMVDSQFGMVAEEDLVVAFSKWSRQPRMVHEYTLSRYAATNEAEFFAEAWQEYRISPTPRPIATFFGSLAEDAIRFREDYLTGEGL